MLVAVSRFEQLVRASSLPPYCSLDRSGNWRRSGLSCPGNCAVLCCSLMLRSSRTGQLMAVICLDPGGLAPAQLTKVREDLISAHRDVDKVGTASTCWSDCCIQLNPPGGSGASEQSVPAPVASQVLNCSVTTVHFLSRKEPGHVEPAPELLWGEAAIQETLLGRTFNISPQAFFQVNLTPVCSETFLVRGCFAARAH